MSPAVAQSMADTGASVMALVLVLPVFAVVLLVMLDYMERRK